MNTGQQTNPNPPNAAGGNISGQQNPASQTSNQQPQTTQNQQGGQPNLNQSASGAQTTNQQSSGQAGAQKPAGGGLFTNTGAGSSGGSSIFGGSNPSGGASGLQSGGLTQSANPNAPKPTTEQISQPEKYIRVIRASNDYLHDFIVNSKHPYSDLEMDKVLSDKKIKEKLVQGLRYYEDAKDKDEQAFKKDVQEGKKTWPSVQGTPIRITPSIEEMIINVRKKLDIGFDETKSLFDLYFELDKNTLKELIDFENIYKYNPIEVNRKRHFVMKKIIEQYYKERIYLLDIIYEMMAIKISGNSKLKNYNPINTFVSENYMKDSFIDMIWNKYRGRKGDKIEPKSVPDSISEIQEREEWIHQNIKEEFYLLKIIFIYYSSGKDCDKKRFIEMFEAFGNQNFAGSYIDFEKQVTIRSINEKIEEFAWMIVDISILILLSCLKLNKSSFAENIFKEKKDELDKLFTKHKQNQFLGPLTYLYYKITNQQSDVSPESIMEIDKRPLFAKCDKYSLSKFRTTIIYWVQCLSQKIVKKNENYEFLLQVAGKCLNETEKIDKFWKNELGLEELYNFVKDEFFISIEKSFNNSTPGYLEFLLKLLGNKHHNHINNVMNELFELKGRFWDRLAAYWTESLHNPRNKQKVFEYLYVPIKLICKILIYDNSFADVITNLLTNTQDKIIQGYHTISLLLVRSLHTFQGQEKVPFDTIAIIYKTLGALQSNLACSANVASLIQLYPRVIMADYQGNDYPSSILQQTLNLEGNLHPLLEIFNLFRKMDNTLKNTENKNKIYLAILKLTYEIILNNENIFDQYPSEKYAKEKYEILAVENETQEIVNLIYDISNSTTWSRKPLENLRERLKYRDGPIKFYSAYSFMEDLLKIVYNIILDTYDKTISTEKTVHKKWKIGNLIFKISDLLLRKYLVNLERFHVSQVRTDNTLLQKITQYLNGSKLTEMIVKTMEVVESDEKDSENPLGLDNKIWYTYIAKGDLRLSKKEHFRQMLASCLCCLETLTHLIEIYHENNVIDPQDRIQQPEVNKLYIVDEFEKLLTKKEYMHYYNYITTKNLASKNSKEVQINIVLALFSYINFEELKGLGVIRKVDSYLEQIYRAHKAQNAMVLEETGIDEIYNILDTDPETLKNMLLKSRTKNNTSINLISTLALRVLSRLVILWDDNILQGKLRLLDFTSISIKENLGFNSKSLLKNIIDQFLYILLDYEAHIEDACALMEFLTVCLYSQRIFVDAFLKEVRDEKRDYFKKFILKFFDTKIKNVNNKLLIKVLTFLYEVFQRENEYRTFVDSIRKQSTFDGLFETVFTNLVPDYEINQRLNNYGKLHDYPKKSDIKFHDYQLDRLINEAIINEVSSNLFGITTAVRFLSDELIKLAKTGPDFAKNSFLKKFFHVHFLDWIKLFTQYEIKDPSNDPYFKNFIEDLYTTGYNKSEEDEIMNSSNKSYLSTQLKKESSITISEFKRFQRKIQRERENSMKVEGANLKRFETLVTKGIYKMMDINLYGYGKDFLYDTQEIYYAMKNAGIIEEDFIFRGIIILNKQNLLNTVFSLEHKCFEALITLFKFCSTLGLSGQAFSSSYLLYSVININEMIKNKAKDRSAIFEEDSRQIALANPNADIDFSKGMLDFFLPPSPIPDEGEKIKKAILFLENLLKICWNSIKDKYQDEEFDIPMMKSLDQKINLMTYALNSLFYLLKTQKHVNTNKKDVLVVVQLYDQGLKQIISQIFKELKDCVLEKILTGFKEFDFDITPYINFELALLLCIKEITLEIQYWNYFHKHLEILESFMNLNIYCLSIIISCLEVLLDINSIEFCNYLISTNSLMIKLLVSKISNENFHEIEFAFIMKLFVKMAENRELAEILDNCNLIWEICSNKRLKRLIETPDYDSGMRNNIQILWCWVMILMKQLIETLHESISFMNSALAFLKEFTPRINYILTLPTKILENNRQMKIEKQSVPVMTVAYFEELECTTAMICEYFDHSNEWAHGERLQFEGFLYMLTHYTLNIVHIPMDSNKLEAIDRQDIVPVAITLFEKNMKEINKFGRMEGPSSGYNELNLKTHKSMKVETDDRTYNLSVFDYKNQVSVLNSLVYVLESIKNGLKYSGLLKYFNEFDVLNSTVQKPPIKYELEYWENFSETLINVINYIHTNCQKWQLYAGHYHNIAQKFDYINNSVACSMQCFGLNNNFQSYSLKDLKEIAHLILDTAYFNLYSHVEMSRCFIGQENIQLTSSIRDKTRKLLGDSSNNLKNMNNIIKNKINEEIIEDDSRSFMELIKDEFK